MSISAISKSVTDRLNAVLPKSGDEPCSIGEGARFIGFVEQSTGTNIWSLLMEHCRDLAGGDADRAQALFVDRPDVELGFVSRLVNHALGLAPGYFPRADLIPPYKVHGGDFASDRLGEFADGAGRLMFADAWGTRESELGRRYPGENLYDIAPDTPDEAILEGARLCGYYEAANGLPIHELFERACIAEYGSREAWEAAEEAGDGDLPDFEHFSNDLAFMALGAGVSWFDDRKKFDLARVGFEYTEEAGLDDPEPADASEMSL